MLGDIDYNLKLIEPKLFLAKPNREIVAKISEAYDCTREMSLTELFSLSFKLPFYIDENNQSVRNRNIDLIRERYHLKVVVGNKVEWYIITKITDTMGSQGDSKQIDCIYLPQELNDKLIGGYQEDSKNARQVLEDILGLTTSWNIEYLDADFELSYRSWEFPDNTLLDAVNQVAEKYNAILEWNTENRTLRLVKPELHGINRIGVFSQRRYLESIEKESNAEIVVTRLRPIGKDGLGIERLTTNGDPHLEDFSYWMYPFERNEAGDILKHSYFMSDDLCNAILDYQELQEFYNGQFGTLIGTMDALTATLAQKRTELNDLKNELATINQIQVASQFNGTMFFDLSTFSGGGKTVNFPVKNLYYYAVLIKVANVAGKTLTVNGTPSFMQSGTWVLAQKVSTGVNNINVTLSGTGTSEVFIQVTNITQAEYNATNNGTALVNKYNFNHKNEEISNKELEIQNVQAQINGVNADLTAIRNALSPQNNFSPAELEELDKYIFTQNYVNETIIEDTDLIVEGKKKFNEYRIPQLNLKIGIVNFMECLEEQGVWNQLYLGDKLIVKYEVFNMRIEAKIIGISFDYENGDIDLTIANFKDLTTGNEMMEKYVYDSNKTTTIVNDNKNKWNQAIVDTSEFSEIFENFWDTITNQINMAVNQTVSINEQGITITDSNDPLRFLRLTNGQVGLTRSGGLRYETAISADGIIAEMVLGKLILGQRVTIGDENGIWLTEGPKTTITDRCGRIAMKLGLYDENPDLFGMVINRYDNSVPCSTDLVNRIVANSEDGFVIQKKNGTVFDDVFYADLNGTLNLKGYFQAGEGNQIFRVDASGMAVGSSVWANAPFRADYFGNVWMNSLFAVDADIENSVFKNGHIIGSSITLGTHPNIIRLDPFLGGFWAGDQNSSLAPAHIAMDGTATFSKLIVTNGNGGLMMDSENKVFDMDQWNMIGAGRIEADSIIVNTAIAGIGVISDLTVKRLITMSKNDNIGTISNYIHVEDTSFMLKTGEIMGRTQLESNGNLLYWTDSTKTLVTTEVTAYPVWDLNVDDVNKLIISFDTTDPNLSPYIQMGGGDGMSELSGKAFFRKPVGYFSLDYHAANTAAIRRVRLQNDGVLIHSENGSIKLEHNTGTYFEISSNGNEIRMFHKTAGDITINTSGMTASISGTVNINASGAVNVSGNSYNFS